MNNAVIQLFKCFNAFANILCLYLFSLGLKMKPISCDSNDYYFQSLFQCVT